jgi:hypothetical protein
VIERFSKRRQRGRPILAVGDQLGEHRIEAGIDLIGRVRWRTVRPDGDAGVDPDPGRRGPADTLDPAC